MAVIYKEALQIVRNAIILKLPCFNLEKLLI